MTTCRYGASKYYFSFGLNGNIESFFHFLQNCPQQTESTIKQQIFELKLPTFFKTETKPEKYLMAYELFLKEFSVYSDEHANYLKMLELVFRQLPKDVLNGVLNCARTEAYDKKNNDTRMHKEALFYVYALMEKMKLPFTYKNQDIQIFLELSEIPKNQKIGSLIKLYNRNIDSRFLQTACCWNIFSKYCPKRDFVKALQRQILSLIENKQVTVDVTLRNLLLATIFSAEHEKLGIPPYNREQITNMQVIASPLKMIA